MLKALNSLLASANVAVPFWASPKMECPSGQWGIGDKLWREADGKKFGGVVAACLTLPKSGTVAVVKPAGNSKHVQFWHNDVLIGTIVAVVGVVIAVLRLFAPCC